MPQKRFELLAFCSASKRSIQLSYWGSNGLNYTTEDFRFWILELRKFSDLKSEI